MVQHDGRCEVCLKIPLVTVNVFYFLPTTLLQAKHALIYILQDNHGLYLQARAYFPDCGPVTDTTAGVYTRAIHRAVSCLLLCPLCCQEVI